MIHLLNTLFVTSEDIYLSLDGENVVASREHQEAARYPLHTLSGIVSFSYPGASPALMGACAERGISLAFCTPRGRFLARIAGSTSGNVLLRRAQYRTADELSASCRPALLCLQSALARLRLCTGERGAGFLRGLSPPGSPWPGLSGPGSDGGAAPLYGRPVRFNPDKQPNGGAAGL